MRTITLELLRHGPAHNQLLSPLTPYLALCENHGAVTLHMPFEHSQFLHRLDALGYRLSPESRLFQLQDTARVMGDILAAIPGLTAEANRESASGAEGNEKDGTGEPLTHLRLIISASELALLPFELAVSPGGLPGAGQHLLLQSQVPVCLTRETRRSPGEQLRWPERPPRILFAAASPRKVGPIPLDAHLLVLRRVIQPWVKYYDPEVPEMRRKRVEEHLVFLPEASIEAIENECASGDFTHVHILAHGVDQREEYDTRFFLALHRAQSPGEIDHISGARLASALRASHRSGAGGLARPAVVTLASCNAGNVGSVAGAGASIAHALHEAGIPMVVAGQFPLSFDGSVRLLEVLYEGLLWAKDPRPLLHDLRRRLYSQFRDTHDWASLTAYASLPPDFERQLSGLQIGQAMRSINAAMNHADEATRGMVFKRTKAKKTNQAETRPAPDDSKTADLLKSAGQKIEASKTRLETLIKRLPREQARIHGLLASTEKRHAENLFSTATRLRVAVSGGGTTEALRSQDVSNELLRRARDHYWRSFVLDRSKSWAVVQYLSLTMVMRHSPAFSEYQPTLPEPATVQDRPEADPKALWTLSRLLSLYDMNSDNRERRIWAHGNLIELCLLSLVPPLRGLMPPGEADRQAIEHTDVLVDIAGRGSLEVYSTRRQVYRYMEWYSFLADVLKTHTEDLATRIFDRFPAEVEERVLSALPS